jgi:MFS family permease
LTFGRVYKYYPTKWMLVALVAIFEIGSIVCAAAPTSNALIVGRVVSGIGAAGIASGSFMLITILLPLQKRPKYSGGLGAVFGVASILGPVAGGNLTQVSWRWCFWINVPIGGVALLFLLVTPARAAPVKPAATWWGKGRQLDPIGFVLISSATSCLLFALQWGGVRYAWNDGRIIALFVVCGLLAAAFVAAQAWLGDEATVPWKIVSQRSILAGCFAQLGIGSVLVGYAFYLPIWFQVIQGKSPQSSGLSLLALLLSNVVAVMAGGIATSKLGYYTPFMIAGGVVGIVGSALIATWTVNVDAGKWISYQVR